MIASARQRERRVISVAFGHEFSQVVDRCCGLDAHKKVIVATVEVTGIARETREFKSTTRSLTELKGWLLE